MARAALTKLLLLVILAFIICLPEFFTFYQAYESRLEVSAELRLPNAETLNLTLYGRSNQSSLHLYPPEEEEEEKGGDEGQRKAFYCCLPLLPNSESANQSRCLLWFANQTVWNSTAKEKLPWKRKQKDEWQCTLRVVWLALLCLVLLSIVTSVIGQIYKKRRLCRKPKVHPDGFNLITQQLNDGAKEKEVSPPEAGTNLHSYGFHTWSGLSPIKEVDSQHDISTLMDGNADHCYTGFLHHRSHPSVSSIKDEQAR
ncbi:unnamed protein product [Oreochromis niloticus]|nr:unnamed protein product [Mustela putorius furo]